MLGRSDCRVLDGCESGRDGKACDGLPAVVGCIAMFLPSGLGGTDEGCIGGPGLGADLPITSSCWEGVGGRASECLGPGFAGSLSLEEGPGVPGAEISRFDALSFVSRGGACWAPLLQEVSVVVETAV